MFLSKWKDEAVAAVPEEFRAEMSLVGPVAGIHETLPRLGRLRHERAHARRRAAGGLELMASLAR